MSNSKFIDYMTWLSEDCKVKFDNDEDLKSIDISVSKDIDHTIKIFNRSIVGKTKEEAKKSLIDMINATIQLMQVSNGLIFVLHSYMCAFCWIRDNVKDGDIV